MTRALLLYLRAPVSARQLALTALTASQTMPVHHTSHEHMVTEMTVVCSGCLCDFSEALPLKARRTIELTAAAVPLDSMDRWSLAAEQVVDQVVSLASTAGLVSGPVPEPPASVSAALAEVAETPTDLGSFPRKLADLLREPDL